MLKSLGSIRLFYTSVSLLLSRTQGYCDHLSKFHIYTFIFASKNCPVRKASQFLLYHIRDKETEAQRIS